MHSHPRMDAVAKKAILTTMTTKEIILIFYCYIYVGYAKPYYPEPLESLWKDVKPGELLRSLDAITTSTRHIINPVQWREVNIKNIIPKQSNNHMRLKRKIGEDSDVNLKEKIPYDYDKAYEEFVKKYFDEAVTDALFASDSIEYNESDAETNSGEVDSSEDHEPIIAETAKCKNIVRGKQNCVICKNSNNGETSESCSYNKETKPQTYGFEKQKNYRKYRATTKNNAAKESIESTHKNPIIRNPNKSNDTLSCIMKKVDNNICYFCKNNVTKCYQETVPTSSSNSNGQAKNSKKKRKGLVKDFIKEKLLVT